MDQKIGIYLCSGCSIGDSLDLEAVKSVAEESSIAKCEIHPHLCGPEGTLLMRNDVNAGEVNCVVAAACSGRVKTDEFYFDPMSTILERLNFASEKSSLLINILTTDLFVQSNLCTKTSLGT